MALIRLPSLFHVIEGEYPQLSGEFTKCGTTDPDLVRRLSRSFVKSSVRMEDREDTVWHVIAQRHHTELVRLLKSEDVEGLSRFFGDIHRTGALKGIDQDEDLSKKIESSPEERDRLLLIFKDLLVRLAEAIGCLPLEIPGYRDRCENLYLDTDEVVKQIEERLEIDISPPAVTAGRFGLSTSTGAVFTNRDTYALYCAFRLKELTEGNDNPRVCEIGGGMGRVAYYANRLGIKNYTLIDLPQISAVQGFWLSRALDDRVLFHGEEPDRKEDHFDGIVVLPSWCFPEIDVEFDVVLNTDSMPEMGWSIAPEYADMIKEKGKPTFLSINQEARKQMVPGGPSHAVVADVIRKSGGYERLNRFPFWLRKGYVEELYRVL